MTQVETQVPRVGQEAPDFTLQDADRKPVSLHDFRGKTVILAFFPAAFSGVCTTEMCSFRDSLARLNSADAQVLGISVDLPFTLKQFGEANNLNFPLLSDFDKQVGREYGVLDYNFSGFSGGVERRSVFVIGPDGKIAWEWLAESPGNHPPYDEVLQQAEAVSKNR